MEQTENEKEFRRVAIVIIKRNSRADCFKLSQQRFDNKWGKKPQRTHIT